MTFDDFTPLGDVREWLSDNLEKGVECPACEQKARIYKRPLPAATAVVLIKLWRENDNQGRDFVYLPKILDTMKGTPHQGGYGTLGRWWGLMQPMPGIRPDGSNRMGWWKLTDLGRAFVTGRATVPKYAWLYSGELLLVQGEPVTIRDALGEYFNYRNLMNG